MIKEGVRLPNYHQMNYIINQLISDQIMELDTEAMEVDTETMDMEIEMMDVDTETVEVDTNTERTTIFDYTNNIKMKDADMDIKIATKLMKAMFI